MASPGGPTGVVRSTLPGTRPTPGIGPTTHVPTFSLTSFNARWGLTVDDVPFDVGRAVQSFDTDLVALQEVWDPDHDRGAVARQAAELGYQVVEVPLSRSWIDPRPAITAEPDDSRGTWGIALLSRRPIQRVRIVDLGRMVERWDVADRHAVLADVDVDGTTVSVAALHLSFALPNAVAQLRRLDGYLPTDRPSVVVGDCNLWGPMAVSLLRRHVRAVRGRTWPAHRPHSQLDHVLVSTDIAVERSAVLPPAGSDHRPIQATLRIPGRRVNEGRAPG